MQTYKDYNNKKAKIYLNKVRKIGGICREQQETLEELKAEPQKLTSVCTGMPRSGRIGDLSDIVARTTELQNKLIMSVNEKITLYTQAIFQIEMMENDTFSEILHAYYINHKTWEQVAVDSGYNFRYLMRMKEIALEEFQKEYKQVIESHIDM